MTDEQIKPFNPPDSALQTEQAQRIAMEHQYFHIMNLLGKGYRIHMVNDELIIEKEWR